MPDEIRDAVSPAVFRRLLVTILFLLRGAANAESPSVPEAVWLPPLDRNHVSTARGLPDRWAAGEIDRKTGEWKGGDRAENILWASRLGSETYGSPVVWKDQVFCATNNGAGYLPRFPAKQDLGCLLAFSRNDGRFLWQYSAEVLPDSHRNWPLQGICSTPWIEGDRLWIVTNRGSVACLDTEGFRDGEDDGPTADATRDEYEADVVWEFDMIGRLGIVPRFMTSSMPAAVGPWVFVATSNGTDDKGRVANPDAPSLIALDKTTGELKWADTSPGANILEGQWSSPAFAVIAGVPQLIFGGGDGWVYAFEVDPAGKQAPSSLWRFDVNPKAARFREAGLGDRDYLVAPPVVCGDRVYLATGCDPQWGEGQGRLWCVDARKRGDLSAELVVDSMNRPVPPRREIAVDPAAGEKVVSNPNSGVIWLYTGDDLDGDGKRDVEETYHRALAAPVVAEGLVIAADATGIVHCVDAESGRRLWSHDMFAAVWGTPLAADGKAYVSDEDGDTVVFALARERRILGENTLGEPIYTSPAAIDGILYFAAQKHLFAIGTPPRR